MKQIILFVVLLSTAFFNGCKKNDSPISKVLVKCRPATEYTNLSGNDATYQYAYSTDGNISLIKKYIGGGVSCTGRFHAGLL